MLEIKDISARYQGKQLAVEAVSYTVEEPSIIGIIGPNGAGKSTLIKAMLNLIDHEGSLTFNGQPLKTFQKEIAYVEQKSAVDYTFPITVKECVSLGLYPKKRLLQRLTTADWQKVEEALAAVDMLEYQERQIGELSGGQFQRVLIARCLVQEADVIFLDEPFAGIDSVSEDIIMQTLQTLKQEGKTILIVHHDLSKVPAYFDQVLLLHRKLIAFGKTEETFTKENLHAAYGHELFIGGGVG